MGGWRDDGDFFHHALAGFVQEGLCGESALPYREHFDPDATPSNEVRAAMHGFGGSVVVALMTDILKIHVHTDTPEAVFSYAARWGRVETTKADDVRDQHRRLAHAERRPVAVVTDTSADLADSVLDRHHIALVPLQVVFGDESFRDRVELKPEEFYRRLRTARDLPTTSQPTNTVAPWRCPAR